MMHQGEIVLVSTPQGTDILEEDGFIVTDGGLAAMCKIALFGGNRDDTGVAGCRCQWWGNEGVPSAQKVRARTQHLAISLPLTSATLPKLAAAARADLEFLKAEKLVDALDVTARAVGPTTVEIAVCLHKDGQSALFETYRMETRNV